LNGTLLVSFLIYSQGLPGYLKARQELFYTVFWGYTVQGPRNYNTTKARAGIPTLWPTLYIVPF